MLEALGYGVGDGPVSPAEPDRGLLALGLAALRHFSLDYEYPEPTNRYHQHSLAIAQALPDSQEKAFTLLLNSIGPGSLILRQRMELCQQCIGIFRRPVPPRGAKRSLRQTDLCNHRLVHLVFLAVSRIRLWTDARQACEWYAILRAFFVPPGDE